MEPINFQEIQKRLENIADELNSITAEGSSGGGLVKICINTTQILSLEIDPIAVDKDDIPMLQDLIRAAYNSAYEKILLKQKEIRTGILPFNLSEMVNEFH